MSDSQKGECHIGPISDGCDSLQNYKASKATTCSTAMELQNSSVPFAWLFRQEKSMSGYNKS